MIRPQHGGNRGWAAALANCSPEQLLDFSASLNPLGPPSSVRRALAAALEGLEAISTYPDPESRQLRAALAQAHRLDPEWILVGNGAAELFTWAARDSAAHAETLLPVPAFGDYGRALRAAGARIRPLLLQHEMVEGGGAIWINNPHNPSGHLWPRQELLALLPRFDLVVVDEAFMDFVAPDQTLLGDVESWPQLVVIRSLTKFYSIPGLRLGFAVAHPQRLGRWQQWRDPWSINGLATVAGLAALRDSEFRRQTLAWLPEARAHLQAGLADLPGCRVEPSAANFLLAQLQGSATALQQALLTSDQILIRDCLSFPELGDAYFRVGVRTIAEQERLLAACRRCLGHSLVW